MPQPRQPEQLMRFVDFPYIANRLTCLLMCLTDYYGDFNQCPLRDITKEILFCVYGR